MRAFQIAAVLATCAMFVGCASVRQADLDAWKGMPVEALDTHSLFATMPMTRRLTESGIEMRNYSNTVRTSTCTGNAFTAHCFSSDDGCNNLFYIRNGKVIEYAPTGQCMTDDSVRPQKRFSTLSQSS